MALYRLIYGVTYAVSLSLAQKTTFNAVEMKNFVDVTFGNYILDHEQVVSRIACTMLCQWNNQCMSFVYATGTRLCVLHETVFASHESTFSFPGARYYVAGRKDLCPIDEDYVHVRSTNTCHRLVYDMTVPFRKAEETCLEYGGHLSKFDSDAERQAIIDLIFGSDIYIGLTYHTGAHKDGPGNTWVWRDGTNALITSYWLPGQPTGDGACAYMYTNSQECLFNAAPCESWRFMCEIDI